MIGGFKSFYNLLPFLVEIIVFPENPNMKSLTCSGSLLSYEWVLTAAHCSLKPEKYYYLGAGLTDATIRKQKHVLKFNYGQTRRLQLIRVHEHYDNSTHFNDIALMKVRVPFKEAPDISLAPIPVEAELDDLSKLYNRCYIGGWGRIGPNNMLKYDEIKKKWIFNNDERRTTKVAYLILPLISNEQCRRLWQRDIRLSFSHVSDEQICTLYYPGRKANCRGDSGGPLICGSKQYGIVSYSYSCGKPRIGADVYTRVDKYINWINNTIAQIEKNKKKQTQIAINADYYDDNHTTSITLTPNVIFVLVFNLIVCYVFQYF